MTIRRLLTPLFALGLPSAALCEESELHKIAEGRILARQVCSACHDIGKDRPWEPTLRPPAPGFARLAQKHKLDEAYLRSFLSAPHGARGMGKTKMPNPQLLDYQIDNLVAYLRARQTR